jgi:hypothetical protein
MERMPSWRHYATTLTSGSGRQSLRPTTRIGGSAGRRGTWRGHTRRRASWWRSTKSGPASDVGRCGRALFRVRVEMRLLVLVGEGTLQLKRFVVKVDCPRPTGPRATDRPEAGRLDDKEAFCVVQD